MAHLILYPPMPRMLGVSPEFNPWETDVSLSAACTLGDSLKRMADEINPLFLETVRRTPKTYFEQIRIAVDGWFARSDDYGMTVEPNSTVIIMSPLIDG